MFMIDPGADSLFSVLGLSPDATRSDITGAAAKLKVQLNAEKKSTSDPDKLKLLGDREREISDADERLSAPKEREKYDRENTHLRFFTIMPTAAPFYVTPVDRVYVLHRMIRRFLAAKGVELPPLTEVETTGSVSDWTPG